MINITITAGKTFTDETIEDADLNNAASPSASVPDGSITSDEIDNSLWETRYKNLDISSNISWNVIPGRIFQAAKLESIDQDNFVINVYGMESGMYGWISIKYGATITGFTVNTDGFTDYYSGGGSAFALTPTASGSRHIVFFYSFATTVVWRSRTDFT